MANTDLVGIFQQGIDSVFGGSDWLATSVLALLLSAIMSSLAWMLSSVFESKDLKGWAKKELNEFILTGVLIAILFPLLTIISMLSIAYVGGDPYSLANEFLTKVENELLSTYASLFAMKISFATVSQLNLPLGPVITLLSASTLNLPAVLAGLLTWLSGIVIPLGSPFSLVVEPIDSLFSTIQPILLAFFIQKELLFIIEKTMLSIILPLGILLRAFPLTRRAGSTLMAIAVTAYVIYPITLVVVGGMYDTTLSELPQLTTFPDYNPFYGYYVKTSPPAGKYYLNESDTFEWLALNNLSYRLWAEKDCKDIQGMIYESELFLDPSPYYTSYPPINYVYWRVKQKTEIIPPTCGEPGGSCLPQQIDSYVCYQQVAKGSVNQSQTFSWQLKEIMLKQNEENNLILMTNYTLSKIIKDSQGNSTTAYETLTIVENNKFYFGDPCKEGLWSSLYCILAKSDKEQEVKDIPYARLIMLGAKGLFSGFSEFGENILSSISQAGTGSVVGAVLPPVVAGYSFIYLTDQLPRIIFPYVIVLFNFVIIILVFVSSFKSISETIGGETTIVELGRLI